MTLLIARALVKTLFPRCFTPAKMWYTPRLPGDVKGLVRRDLVVARRHGVVDGLAHRDLVVDRRRGVVDGVVHRDVVVDRRRGVLDVDHEARRGRVPRPIGGGDRDRGLADG